MDLRSLVDLAPFTTFKIGGKAKYFLIVKTNTELIEAVIFAQQHNWSYFILGGGTNVLFTQDVFNGLVIKNEAAEFNISDDKVNCAGGCSVNLIVNRTVDEGLGGLEYFAGHPGTIGGSIYINAHTRDERGSTILLGNLVSSAVVFDQLNARTITVERDYFKFAYDYSSLKESKNILLSVTFQLTSGQRDELKKRADWIRNYRKTTQNYGDFTAGCVFQNPTVGGSIVPAGKLIEEAGLKGYIIGGARISQKHANFIVNFNQAKAKDILELINLCKTRVWEKFGVNLKIEIEII